MLGDGCPMRDDRNVRAIAAMLRRLLIPDGYPPDIAVPIDQIARTHAP